MTAVYIILSIIIIFAAAFVFAISGRRSHPAYDEFFGMLCAHRGLHENKAPYDRPENSLAAFDLAAERGYGIELDVHLSSDGIPVVFHDDTLTRVCGIRRRVSEMTAEELTSSHLFGGSQTIPTFDEVLRTVGGRVPLIVELKLAPEDSVQRLCETVAPMLDGYGGSYSIESFNPGAVRWYRKNRPAVFRGQLSSAFFKSKKTLPYFLMQNLLVNCAGRPDFVAYDRGAFSVSAFRFWRYVLRMPVASWTVRSQAQLDEILSSCAADCNIFEGFIPDVTK